MEVSSFFLPTRILETMRKRCQTVLVLETTPAPLQMMIVLQSLMLKNVMIHLSLQPFQIQA